MNSNPFWQFILFLHIACGFLSLACALGAMLAVKGQSQHRQYGKGFLYGMTGVFVTAMPLSIVKNDLFLLLIGIFSYYPTLMGWRYAKNRSGKANGIDRTLSFIMLLTALAMIVAATTGLYTTAYKNIVLLVFGGLASISSFRDLTRVAITGKQRIAKHLQAMLGATIAALTAFSVTNLHFLPTLLAWFGPTLLLVPVISWWSRKVLATR